MKIPKFNLMFDEASDKGGAKIDNLDLSGVQDKAALNSLLDDKGGDDDEEKEEKEDDGEKDGQDDDDESKGSRKRNDEDVDEEDDVNDNKDDEDEDDEEDADDEDDEDDDKDKNDNDLEDDNDGDDEEDLESKSLYQKLKSKHKDIFKEFPELRDAIHRNNQFSEIFGSPKEAEVAQENSGILAHLYSSISSGEVDKVEKVLSSIQKNSKEHLTNFVHSVLPAIAKMSPDLYGEVLKIPIKRALQSMYADGVKAKNKNLAAAAIYAHEFFFDSQDIKSEIENPLKVTKSKEREDLDKEKEEFQNTKLTEFRGDVNKAITHSMQSSVTKALEGLIGAEGKELSSYEKRNLIRDIVSEIDSKLESDKGHQTSIDSLVRQAKSSGLNGEWKSRIISAYLGRARAILPVAKLKVLKEAGIKVKQVSKDVRRIVPGSSSSHLGSKDKIDWDKVDYRRTSDMDILNDKPKYKAGK